MLQVQKTLGKKPKQLEELSTHTIPVNLDYLWDWYEQELFNGGKLTWTELDSWSRLTRRQLLPWELDVIRSLDTIYLKVQHDGSS